MNVTLLHKHTMASGTVVNFSTDIDIEDLADRESFAESVEEWQDGVREQIEDEDATIDYVATSDDVPERLMGPAGPKDTFWDYYEAWAGARFRHDVEVYWAAEALDIPADEVREAYAGTARSDEEFAENLANDLGMIPDNVEWPMTHIDWESAAASLMSDYTENDGFYFRDL